MRFLRYSYFGFLVFLNLLGSNRSQEEDISEFYNNETSSIVPFRHRRDLVKNQLIREVYADVKSMLRYFPDVSTNINQTGRSITDMKSFVFGCMSEIKAVQKDVTTIKLNLTTMMHDMEKRGKFLMQTIRNGSRNTNLGLFNLGKNYRHLKEDYKIISNDLNHLVSSLDGHGTPGIEVGGPQPWPMIEHYINNTGIHLSALLSNQEDMKMTLGRLTFMLSNPEEGKTSMEHVPHPTFHHETLPSSTAMLRDLLSNQHQIKMQIEQSRHETITELTRVEDKLELAVLALNEDNKLIHERIISDIIKVMIQIGELKDHMSSITCQAPADHTEPFGNPYRSYPKRLSPLTTRLNPFKLIKYWPIISKVMEVLNKIQSKKPVMGVGGGIGFGKFLEAPKELKDLTAVFGGVSGLAMLQEPEIKLLQELLVEISPLIGIPLPISMQSGDLPGLPIGSPEARPSGYPDRPIGYPAGKPGKPMGNQMVSPRPADPPTTQSSWFGGLGDLSNVIGSLGNMFGSATTEPTVLPTVPTAGPGISPEDQPEIDGLPDLPSDTLLPPVIEGIPGLVPDLPISPTPKPTLPTTVTTSGPASEVPDPTTPELPKPTPVPVTTPSPPEPPTVLEPLTVLKSDGLQEHCACSCPCECTCPILPLEFPKNSPLRQWWKPFQHYRKHGSGECRCLCACPCPAGAKPQSGVIQESSEGPAEDISTIQTKDSDGPSWVPPMHDYDAMGPDDAGNDLERKIDGISRDIRELKADFKVLRISVRDEMVITREAIMSQIQAKIAEVTGILAGAHRANVILHSNDKNATDNVKEFVKGEFMRTWYTLKNVGGAIVKMNTAVENMLKTYYKDPNSPQYSPYWQKRHHETWTGEPLKRRSRSSHEAVGKLFLPEGFNKEQL